MPQATPPQPVHVPGTHRGEEMVFTSGREAGRGHSNLRDYRCARDSTGINADKRRPIHPDMPSIPPA
jgi:hypothetical protein